MHTTAGELLGHVTTWWLLCCLLLVLVDTRRQILKQIHKKGREIMSNVAAALAVLARVNTATNTLAAEIRDLTAKLAAKTAEGGMTQTEEDEIIGGFSNVADRLESMATPADPETHMEHPDTTSAVTSEVPKPLPFRSSEDKRREAEAAASATVGEPEQESVAEPEVSTPGTPAPAEPESIAGLDGTVPSSETTADGEVIEPKQ